MNVTRYEEVPSMTAAHEAGRRDSAPLRDRTNMDGSPYEPSYRIERKVRGEWITVSTHGSWTRARVALDRAENKHGFRYVRWIEVAP